MNPYLTLGIICVILWAAGLFTGAIRSMSSSLDNVPTVESSKSRETWKKFEDDNDEIVEKQRRLMDDAKSKAENLKSKMERNRY